jgi:hypothetical protein
MCVCFDIGTSTRYPFSTWSSFEPVDLIPFRKGVTNFTCCAHHFFSSKGCKAQVTLWPMWRDDFGPVMFRFEPLSQLQKGFDPNCHQRLANPNHQHKHWELPLVQSYVGISSQTLSAMGWEPLPWIRSSKPWPKSRAAGDSWPYFRVAKITLGQP